jgi:hypothetical protein
MREQLVFVPKKCTGQSHIFGPHSDPSGTIISGSFFKEFGDILRFCKVETRGGFVMEAKEEEGLGVFAIGGVFHLWLGLLNIVSDTLANFFPPPGLPFISLSPSSLFLPTSSSLFLSLYSLSLPLPRLSSLLPVPYLSLISNSIHRILSSQHPYNQTQ